MSSFLTIAGWVIWGLSLVLCTTFLVSRHSDGGVRMLSQRYAGLISIGLVVTILTDVSKLHLLWWVPIAYPLNKIVFSIVIKSKLKRFEKNFMGGVLPEEAPRNHQNSPSESGNNRVFAPPLIGEDIKWSKIVRHIFRVLEFDRTDTTILEDGTVKVTTIHTPYGYLLVESPILDDKALLPICHRDDFALATTVYDDPQLTDLVTEDELLVTYYPKNKLPMGFGGMKHYFHYVIVPRGTLERYYKFNKGEHVRHPEPEKIFKRFVWDGEIQVGVNPDPEV